MVAHSTAQVTERDSFQMNTIVAQAEARSDVLPPRSAWHTGFVACMHYQPYDKAQSDMWRRGWMAGLSAEAEANTPKELAQ